MNLAYIKLLTLKKQKVHFCKKGTKVDCEFSLNNCIKSYIDSYSEYHLKYKKSLNKDNKKNSNVRVENDYLTSYVDS